MRAFGALVLAFALSACIAGAVQVQLGLAFKGDRDELIITMVILLIMSLITTVALGLALAGSSKVSGINWTASVLFVLTMLLIFGFASFVAFVMAPNSPIVREDIRILAEIAVPIAVMIPIQWWLARRHFLRNAARASTGGGASV
jgi:CBS domain containing-hemolysin-like protein